MNGLKAALLTAAITTYCMMRGNSPRTEHCAVSWDWPFLTMSCDGQETESEIEELMTDFEQRPCGKQQWKDTVPPRERGVDE